MSDLQQRHEILSAIGLEIFDSKNTLNQIREKFLKNQGFDKKQLEDELKMKDQLAEYLQEKMEDFQEELDDCQDKLNDCEESDYDDFDREDFGNFLDQEIQRRRQPEQMANRERKHEERVKNVRRKAQEILDYAKRPDSDAYEIRLRMVGFNPCIEFGGTCPIEVGQIVNEIMGEVEKIYVSKQ